MAAPAGASIEANGRAVAEALSTVAEAWRESDGKAMDMYVLQNIEEIFAQVAKAAGNLKVRQVSLVDAGSGDTLPAYVSAFPATVSHLMSEVTRATGVDINRIMTGGPGADGNGKQGVRVTSSHLSWPDRDPGSLTIVGSSPGHPQRRDQRGLSSPAGPTSETLGRLQPGPIAGAFAIPFSSWSTAWTLPPDHRPAGDRATACGIPQRRGRGHLKIAAASCHRNAIEASWQGRART